MGQLSFPLSDSVIAQINCVGLSTDGAGNGSATFQKVLVNTTDGATVNEGAPIVVNFTDGDQNSANLYTPEFTKAIESMYASYTPPAKEITQ